MRFTTVWFRMFTFDSSSCSIEHWCSDIPMTMPLVRGTATTPWPCTITAALVAQRWAITRSCAVEELFLCWYEQWCGVLHFAFSKLRIKLLHSDRKRSAEELPGADQRSCLQLRKQTFHVSVCLFPSNWNSSCNETPNNISPNRSPTNPASLRGFAQSAQWRRAHAEDEFEVSNAIRIHRKALCGNRDCKFFRDWRVACNVEYREKHLRLFANTHHEHFHFEDELTIRALR
jgi:hypothetical protein